MIRRKMTALVKNRLTMYPAVALAGPRQAGKTTLAKSMNGIYFDLEKEEDRLKLDLQWDEIIARNKLIIFDEAQTHSELFPKLRSAIDEKRSKRGRFLLLGSVSPVLMNEISQSLAGRLGICELTPFLISELPKKKQDRYWLTGGYPDGGILKPEHFPIWQKDYLEIFSQRDLPNLGLSARPQLTQRFFKMLAVSQSLPWNASQIAKSLGLTYHTVNNYLDYLQFTYLVRFLPPFHTNIGKRLIKAPKFYWRDSGLLHMLLGCASYDELLSQPWVGQSFEGMIIEQIIAHLQVFDIPFEAYYFRTSDQYELDLLLKIKNKLWAIEIKLTSSPGNLDFKRLNNVADMVKAEHRVFISKVNKTVESKKGISTNLQGFIDRLARLA